MAMPKALTKLREQYLAQIRALIAAVPAQAQNEAYYLHLATTAQMGIMRRDVSTKGDYSTFGYGETVLVWPPAWAMATDIAIWHPRNDVRTVVEKSAVSVVTKDGEITERESECA